jgi:thiol peroxidase
MRSKHFGLDYGVLFIEGAVVGLLSRYVFVISHHKKISYIEIVSEVTQEPNYTHLESALK